MTDELKLIPSNNYDNKRSDYGSVVTGFNSKRISTSTTVDHGQERLNQLGYKQVITKKNRCQKLTQNINT